MVIVVDVSLDLIHMYDITVMIDTKNMMPSPLMSLSLEVEGVLVASCSVVISKHCRVLSSWARNHRSDPAGRFSTLFLCFL